MMKRWLVEMSSKFAHFMRYRYGQDQLNNFLAIVYLMLVIVRMFIKDGTLSLIIYGLLVGIAVTILLRFFSKNKSARYKENGTFLKLKYRLRHLFNKNQRKAQNRRQYKYFDCPNCKQTLRVPRGKGKIEVTCPKCQTKFEKRT